MLRNESHSNEMKRCVNERNCERNENDGESNIIKKSYITNNVKANDKLFMGKYGWSNILIAKGIEATTFLRGAR